METPLPCSLLWSVVMVLVSAPSHLQSTSWTTSGSRQHQARADHPKVRAAIDEGRSVEAALDIAAMPDYGAYSLFEWAHKTVNVPAAYRDLRDTATEELGGGEHA